LSSETKIELRLIRNYINFVIHGVRNSGYGKSHLKQGIRNSGRGKSN